MAIVLQEQPETIFPSLELPITQNPVKLIKEQILVWVVSNQPRLWLTGVPETQVMVTLQEGCARLPLR